MTSSATDSPTAAQPWRFTLRGLFIVVTLLALALAGFQYLMAHARKFNYHGSSHNNLKQTLIALWNWNDILGCLPSPVQRDGSAASPGSNAAGEPLYSWRYRLMPFLEATVPPVYDAAWDAPANASWRATNYRVYCWPEGESTSGNTHIFAITGPGTAWGDGTTPPLSLEDLDGDTILIVEVRNSGTHWMQPGDFDIRTMPRTINAPDGKGISGEYPDGFHIGLSDGSVRFLPSNVPFEVLENFFTVEGAKQYDLDEELEKYSLK